MKQYVLLIALLLSITLVGCNQESTIYNNGEFGYSVKMPKSWKVIDNPVNMFSKQALQNTVGFIGESSYSANLLVEVIPKGDAYSAVIAQHLWPETEYKVHEYGKNNYIVYQRYASGPRWSNWMMIYYIEYNGFLYQITFSDEATTKKAYVSIDGYGKVNY